VFFPTISDIHSDPEPKLPVVVNFFSFCCVIDVISLTKNVSNQPLKKYSKYESQKPKNHL